MRFSVDEDMLTDESLAQKLAGGKSVLPKTLLLELKEQSRGMGRGYHALRW